MAYNIVIYIYILSTYTICLVNIKRTCIEKCMYGGTELINDFTVV